MALRGHRPGFLPAQAPDHAAGYVLGARVLDAVDRAAVEPPVEVRVSSRHGELLVVPPAVLLGGRPLARDVGGDAADRLGFAG